MESAIQNAKIVPNIFSNPSAITLSMSLESNETEHGFGFWKFNNSLLTDKCYTQMITKQIPEFISKYCSLSDKGLFWEMIKIEIRASTIIFAKNKAKQKRNEEKDLLMRFNQLQEKIRSKFSEATKVEMDRVKKELTKIASRKTRGAMTRSKAQWYEFGQKNSKYFYNLAKINHKKKHIASLRKEDGSIIHGPKQILEEEERFFKEIYQAENVCPESANRVHLFDGLNTLK